MSTVISKNVQIGADATPANNFTWYQPSTPDGTVRLGSGNSGSVTDLVTLNSTGLGIGTSSPAAKLDVQGASSDQIRVRTAGTEYYRFGRNSSTGYMDFYGSQTGYQGYTFGGVDGTWATINSSGNLGLGVTPSAWGSNFKAIEYANGNAFLAYTGGGPGTLISGNAYHNGTNWIYKTSTYATLFSAESDGAYRWRTAPSGTAGNAISFTQAMTLDSSGNLLVGTTSGSGKLRVVGGGVSTPAIYANNTNATSGDYAAVFGLGANTSNTSSFYLLCTEPGVANRFVIYGNGTYATISDQRLKKNIESARDGYLADAMKLRVVKYNWNSQEDGEAKELGVIAQEVEQIFPGLIQESMADGADTAYKQVKSSVLPFILLKAIQEQQAIIDSLKARLDAANL